MSSRQIKGTNVIWKNRYILMAALHRFEFRETTRSWFMSFVVNCILIVAIIIVMKTVVDTHLNGDVVLPFRLMSCFLFCFVLCFISMLVLASELMSFKRFTLTGLPLLATNIINDDQNRRLNHNQGPEVSNIRFIMVHGHNGAHIAPSRSTSRVDVGITWNTSQNIKFGMKLSPVVWEYMC